jgi:hypothetical protein
MVHSSTKENLPDVPHSRRGARLSEDAAKRHRIALIGRIAR